MEKLVALCYFWAFGLGNKEDYYAELDRLFLENPEDDFLLELETLGSDCKAAWSRFSLFFETEKDVDKFGKELFGGLEKFYLENCNSRSSLEEFGNTCYAIWQSLPASFIRFYRSVMQSMSRYSVKRMHANGIKRCLIIIRRSHENFYRLQQRAGQALATRRY